MPSAAVIDSQSAKKTEAGGPCGYDAGKKIMGRKRHTIVDTDGRTLELLVHGADVQHRDGAVPLLRQSRQPHPFVERAYATSAYNSDRVRDGTSITIEIVRHFADQTGFVVHPRRWVVERTFAWINRNRRLAKDFERTIKSALPFSRLLQPLSRAAGRSRWGDGIDAVICSHIPFLHGLLPYFSSAAVEEGLVWEQMRIRRRRMMKQMYRAIAGVAACVAFMAFDSQARTIIVAMKNKGAEGMMVFEPSFVKAAPGDTIAFKAVDRGHDAVSIGDMLPSSATAFKGKLGQDVSVTLNRPGLYGVKCTPHVGMGMVALIQVGEKPDNTAAARKAAGKLAGLGRKKMIGLLDQVR